MKTKKNARSYKTILKDEYNRLNSSSKNVCPERERLEALEELLNKVSAMQSPMKEEAFVKGILSLNFYPSLAA